MLYLPQSLPESIHLLAPAAGDNSTLARTHARTGGRERRLHRSLPLTCTLSPTPRRVESIKKKREWSESSSRGDGYRRLQSKCANVGKREEIRRVRTKKKIFQAPNAKLQFLLPVSAAGFRVGCPVTHTGNSYPVFITFASKHAGDCVRSCFTHGLCYDAAPCKCV